MKTLKIALTLLAAATTLLCSPVEAAFNYTHPVNTTYVNAHLKGGASGQAAAINDAAKKYNVDAKLLTSIIALESGWGAKCKHYNYSGVRSKSGYIRFDQPLKHQTEFNKYPPEVRCIYYTADLLARRYKHLGSFNAIGKRYCTNKSWPSKIRAIYAEIK